MTSDPRTARTRDNSHRWFFVAGLGFCLAVVGSTPNVWPDARLLPNILALLAGVFIGAPLWRNIYGQSRDYRR